MNNAPAIGFGIRPKLFLLVFAIITFVIAVILITIELQSKDSAKKTVSSSLEQSKNILDAKLANQFSNIEELVVGLSKDGRIRPLVYEQDSLTLQDLSLEYERALEFSSMLILDAEGFVLARSDRPGAIGFSLAGRSQIFDLPLQGKSSQGFIASGGKVLQIVATPVFDNTVTDVVRGVIALSYEISPEMAYEINGSTRSDVSIYTFTYDDKRKPNGVSSIHSTNKVADADLESIMLEQGLWKNYFSMQTVEDGREFILEGENYRALVKPIPRNADENLGFIVTFRSETELLKPFIEIEKRVLVVGAISMIFALMISWILSARVSSPIIDLVQLTKAIENEQYPKRSSSIRRDEIGVLRTALEKMGNSIRDKNELESYLADIADDFSNEIDAIATELPAENTLIDMQKDPNDLDSTVINSETASNVLGDTLSVGSLIADRYRLVKKLGQGTTGVAFLAEDIELDEDVAIKFLFKEYVTSEFAAAFKEEIKLARKITHRNILRTFDFGRNGENFFITMEYVKGYELSQLIDIKGALSPHMSLVLVKQICSALVSAHDNGIIHRDLKPDNMIINKFGVLKIMDFGLAMKVDTKHIGVVNPDDSSQGTTVSGTPKYMAPEQFTGIGLDQRTDIYAVGVILFTLLTGKTPFNAKTIEKLAGQHFSKNVPELSGFLENVNADLEAIINKAMAKKKEDRYQFVSEMLDALNHIST